MPRARNVKPGFFKNEDLIELPFETRLLFIGLWTLADREGRLEDRPKRIKIEVFPCDNVDVDDMLCQLEKGGFIVRYRVGEGTYISIKNFAKHQSPHHQEKDSELPSPNETGTCLDNNEINTEVIQDKPRTNRPDSGYLIPDTCTSSENEFPEDSLEMKNEKRETDQECSDYTKEFETFWNIYPRKKEKKAAFGKWKATKNKGADPNDLIKAATNYNQECKAECASDKYTKLAKTFLGPDEHWRDYVEDKKYGVADKPIPPEHRNYL